MHRSVLAGNPKESFGALVDLVDDVVLEHAFEVAFVNGFEDFGCREDFLWRY
jgi:hypothetical protein